MTYAEHPCFPLRLNDSQKVWRFIDFPKFLSLLEYESLYFSRIDKLGDDLWEGQYPKRITAKVVTIKVDKDMHDLNPDDPSYPSSIEELGQDEQKFFRDSARANIKYNFANCWCLNEYESSNLWQIYSRDKGIAIQSTVGKLKNCFRNYTESDVHLFQVKYIDYDKEAIDDIGWIFATSIHKRKEFEDEKELRALISFSPAKKSYYENKDGINVKVDVDTLIEQIYLSPQSPSWHFFLVENILERFGLRKTVQKSKLSQKPEYG